MHLGYQNPGRSYNLNGATLEEVDEERDLGITIDSKLKFHQQTASAVAKASQMLAVMRHSFANQDELILPLLFKAMDTGISGVHSAKQNRSEWNGCKGGPLEW